MFLLVSQEVLQVILTVPTGPSQRYLSAPPTPRGSLPDAAAGFDLP